jgi:hypothetical protein
MKEKRNSPAMRSYSLNGNISEYGIGAYKFGALLAVLSACVLATALYGNNFVPEPQGIQEGKSFARQ